MCWYTNIAVMCFCCKPRFHCSFGNWFHTYQLVHFLFAATELLHDWKGQESNVLEGTKD